MTFSLWDALSSGSWSVISDRNAKMNFNGVDGQAVLAELATLPVETWSYNTQEASIRHMGPMAQDFKAAFGVGEDDTSISTVDAQGVAFAASQGLNAQLQTKDASFDRLFRNFNWRPAEARAERVQNRACAPSW
jgi:hypothetical protein